MGTYIARQTIKELAKTGYGTVGTKVLVLGSTFKEDCPDLRNFRVFDIIAELKDYGCEVLVHDQYCDEVEAKKKVGSYIGEVTGEFNSSRSNSCCSP